jgi:hypothetical protein
MFSNSFLNIKKGGAAVCIVAIMTFSVPKQADAVLLLLIAPATLSGVVALVVTELVIYCAAGLICGDGGNNSNGTPVNEDDTCTAENYCGMSAAGTVESDGFCNATPPPNSACSGPFPEDPLVIDPSFTRIDNDISVIWDVGDANYPANCTLSGSQIGTVTLSTQTGSTTVTALGPHVYTLECGAEEAQAKVNLVGSQFET